MQIIQIVSRISDNNNGLLLTLQRPWCIISQQFYDLTTLFIISCIVSRQKMIIYEGIVTWETHCCKKNQT